MRKVIIAVIFLFMATINANASQRSFRPNKKELLRSLFLAKVECFQLILSKRLSLISDV